MCVCVWRGSLLEGFSTEKKIMGEAILRPSSGLEMRGCFSTANTSQRTWDATVHGGERKTLGIIYMLNGQDVGVRPSH